ncbi:MarR family transcriptional regulator [uncultured Pseudokineococcus sp.]|uniref:MarR family winged helix-turn-helix transcriptional regulator n=1 Tax=uncultured Pseudokineococcus sp. TaxID=1642928 RepID=UPI00263120A3|nr:MarR family transcriptional regulator [uncultured Pseudokineococcus sp.]
MPERTEPAPVPGAPVDETLAVDLLVIAARFTRWAGRAADGAMPTALWRALSQVDELGPLRVSALAALDRTSQPTATALVQRLERHGWVERSADPEDARASLVATTSEGRERLAEQRAAVGRALAPRLGALSGQQHEDLARGLAVLRDLVAHAPPGG